MSATAQTNPAPLRVMTYNLRFDNPADGENRWSNRKDRVAALIRFHCPDVFGVQEALPHQLHDLETALPEYGWYGAGRDDGKDTGEFSAVFYRRSRLAVLDQGTFWLSPTPEQPGKGWDANVVRVCSWVKLQDAKTGGVLYHFNTHFDHVGEEARQESAKLILARMQSTAGELPAILTGDLNTDPNSVTYRMLANNPSLRDAKNVTKTPHYGPEATWATFDVRQPHGPSDRIDYIFVTPQFTVLKHATLTDSQELRYPSDHLPVIAEVVVQA